VRKDISFSIDTVLLLLILLLVACSLAFQIYVYKTDPTRTFVADLLTPLTEDQDQPVP